MSGPGEEPPAGRPPGPAEVALTLAAWQPVLLADRPRRLDLLRLRTTDLPTARRRVTVHRNHGFEVVTSVWAPFCAYGGLTLDTTTGPWDDTLDLGDGDDDPDLHLVSVDLDRYRERMVESEVLAWLLDRLAELARRSRAEVLVTNWAARDRAGFNQQLARAVADLPGVHVADVAAVAADLGDAFHDHRATAVSGTTWSAAAAVALAREFGLRWLPALLGPPVKAVLVDLDGTLYDGVLGEDGPDGVRLGADHVALQQHLVSLRAEGVFLGVVSRNEPSDVQDLFARRQDFPLRPHMVSASAIGWGSKADGVAEVAVQLGIAPDAVVLLDDNPGELATVRSVHPAVRTLHAADPDQSTRALVHCPGLFRFSRTADDALRVRDLDAARERAAQATAAADPEEYLRSLRIRLRVRHDRADDLPRVAQLAARTNQFTTALLRTTEAELHARHRDGAVGFAVVELEDRLADSGTVAAVLAHRDGRRLVVESITISCRALGRRIETALVEAALGVLAGDDVDEVAFGYATGPRNRPALDWLGTYCRSALDAEGLVAVPWSPERTAAAVAAEHLSIIVEGRHDGHGDRAHRPGDDGPPAGPVRGARG